MKKVLSMLLVLAMLLAMCAGSMAENTLAGQVRNDQVKLTEIFYDVEGGETNGNGFPSSGDAVVRVKKSIAHTDTENEFNVTLDVSTTQDVRLISSHKADAATMLIIDASNSMGYCMTCGATSWHSSNRGHTFQTRLAVAKQNAINLVEKFADLDRASGGHRYMAIVAYNGSSYTVMDWLDVAVEANETTAKEKINALSSQQGTNIEAALMLGANVWNHASVKDIDYKYTILLTDGEPTRYVVSENTVSRDRIQGTSQTVTNFEAVEDVADQAARIKGLDGLSMLYSICIGNVANEKHFDHFSDEDIAGFEDPDIKEKTVLEWLASFSHSASQALDPDQLLSSFQSIISQIQLAAQAWKVDDTMGDYAVFMRKVGPEGIYNEFDVKNGVLNWDVLGSNPVKVTSLGNDGVELQYSLTYRVKLDNLNENYTGGWTDANDVATLTYAVLGDNGMWNTVQPVEFPVPQMQGYKGSLTFNKVYMDGETAVPIDGMEFQMIPDGDSATGETVTLTAESKNGVVTFENIPSGHSYTLVETNAGDEGYADLTDVKLAVALGTVTGGLKNGDTLVNVKKNRTVSLELSKKFEGTDARPASITIEVTHGTHTHTALLNKYNNWTNTITGLEPGETYTITEKGAQIDGYNLTATSATIKEKDVPGSERPLYVTNGSAQATLTLDADESHKAYAVEFTNTYARKVGSATIQKLFKERTGVGADGSPITSAMDSALYANASVTIGFVNANNETVKSVTLPNQGEWAATLSDLPEGTYTIVEENEPEIKDHEFIHLHVLNGNTVVEGNKVTITDGTNLSLVLENHYLKLVGDIRVDKLIELKNGAQDEKVVMPKGHEFKVGVYAQWTENGGVYTPVGQPVTTITVTEQDYGNWQGVSEEIPVGKYLLYELESSTAVDGYTHEGFEFSSSIIEVTHGTEPAYVTLTNRYSKDLGTITVEKLWDDDLSPNFPKPQNINVYVFNAENKLVDTLLLSSETNPAYKDTTINLTTGDYYLVEETRVNPEGRQDYNTADVPGYGHSNSWSDGDGRVTLVKDENKALKLTNHYTAKFATLALGKSVKVSPEGDLPADLKNSLNISFLVDKKNSDGTYTHMDVLELSNETGWAETVNLPLDVDANGNAIDTTYRLLERGVTLPSGSGYSFKELQVSINGDNLLPMEGRTPGETGFEVTFSATGSATVASVSISATNYYTRDTGSLTVKKDFADGSELNETNFNGSIWVNVFDESGNEVTGSPLELKANTWSATLENLPTGKYRLAEDLSKAQRPGYNLAHGWIGGAEVEVTTNGAEKTVRNRYVRQKGNLVITKKFDGLPENLWPANGVTVIATPTDGGAPQTIKIPSNTWQTQVELPVGEYVLSEVTSVPEPANYTKTAPTFKVETIDANGGHTTNGDNGVTQETVQITVAEGTSPRVYVYLTNHYTQDMGTITVTKAFDADSALKEDYFEGRSFDVLVKQGDKIFDKLTLAKTNTPAWTATTKELPVGNYTLEEVVAQGEENTAFVQHYTVVPSWGVANGTVEVTKNTGALVTLTNLYTQHTGDVAVMKRVVSEYDSDKQKEFRFTMTLENTAISGIYGDMTFSGGVAEFTLTDGAMKTAKGLPAGVPCTVTEEAAEGFRTSVNGIVTQTAQNPVVGRGAGMFTFVNTRVSDRELTITKSVDSPLRSDYTKDFSFLVKLDDASVSGKFPASKMVGGTAVDQTVEFTAGEAIVKIKHDEAVTIKELPVGMGFTVTEEKAQNFVSTVKGSTRDSFAGVLGTDTLVEFVNQSTVARAALTVSKTVDGTHASKEDVFTFEVQIPDLMDGVYGDMTFAGGKATVQLKHGQKAVAKNIPVGVVFTVTETDFGAYTPETVEYKGTLGSQGMEAAFVNTLSIPELPSTGDDSSLMLWGAVLAIAGLGALLIKRRTA